LPRTTGLGYHRLGGRGWIEQTAVSPYMTVGATLLWWADPPKLVSHGKTGVRSSLMAVVPPIARRREVLANVVPPVCPIGSWRCEPDPDPNLKGERR
jgi:hypothetical protein